METFFSFLERRVDDCSSLLCVGLDPHPSELPAPGVEAALEFCLRLVRSTARYAAAFKPNAAFFEGLGPDGWRALRRVIEAVGEESARLGSHIPVILDAKRGDIASSAEAYARSAFETLGADAVTLSAYLGGDSVEPFLTDPEKGVFVLCRTSNPGAVEFQELTVADDAVSAPLFLVVARRARAWNGRGNVGLVVGATAPEALERVRQAVPEMWILAPGFGPQGGQLELALQAGLRADGSGLLLPVSRALSRAEDPARAAAELRDRIAEGRHIRPRPAPRAQAPAAPGASLLSLADDLLEAGCVRFGEFRLKSGLTSPVYLDLRRLVSFPRLLDRVAQAYLELLGRLEFDRLAALPYAALPIATAVALRGNLPLVYPRKETKSHGTQAAIEGEHHPGETIVILDDVATTGGSKLEAIVRLQAAGLVVRDVVVLIDRQSGAAQAVSAAGFRLHAALSLTQMLDHWEARGRVPAAEVAAVRRFLARGRDPSG